MLAFILAGGFATRLWPLTEKRAKPLLPLGGKPLLTHLVEKILEGIPITVSTNAVFAEDFHRWKCEMLRRGSAQVRNAKCEIEIVIEDAGHEDEKLGALGATAKWIGENKIDDDVLLLAGDNYIGFSIEAFLQKYQQGTPLLAAYDIHDREKAKQLGTVVMDIGQARGPPSGLRPLDKLGALQSKGEHSPTPQPPPPAGEGENGKNEKKAQIVRAFEEKPQNPRSTLVSTGCFVLPKNMLPLLYSFAKDRPDNIGGIFEHFLKQGIAVEAVAFSDPWFDIGSFEAYLEATKALVGENILLGERATCNASTCNGSVVIGAGSQVADCRLRNVVLFENCEVTDCVLEDCIVDNRCVLRGVDLTGKMLREGTRLVRQ